VPDEPQRFVIVNVKEAVAVYPVGVVAVTNIVRGLTVTSVIKFVEIVNAIVKLLKIA
jgi:hypothetical protein